MKMLWIHDLCHSLVDARMQRCESIANLFGTRKWIMVSSEYRNAMSSDFKNLNSTLLIWMPCK